MALLPRRSGRPVNWQLEDKKVDLAIFASAIRPHLWMPLYESLASSNKCSFKMFFCGHVRPDFELPKNFIHIYSEMPAAPCVEIAYRHAMAENSKYIMHFTDDCILPPNILDKLIQDVRWSEKPLIVGPAYVQPHHHHDHSKIISLHIVTGDEASPLVPLFQVMKRSTSERVGGLDKRFKAIYWDLDRLLRFHALGGLEFKVREDIVISEIFMEKNQSSLWRDYNQVDKPFLQSLWTYPTTGNPNEKIQRSDEVQFYTLEELEFEGKEKFSE